jgi:hypothetical protein
MARITKNDRTITLTQPALKVYDSWPHMEKSKRVSDAIIAKAQNSGGELEARVEKLEKAVEKLEGDK